MKLTLPITLLTVLATASAAAVNTGTLLERQFPTCQSFQLYCGNTVAKDGFHAARALDVELPEPVAHRLNANEWLCLDFIQEMRYYKKLQ
ncbi:hypothetical protein HYFRA_00004706 [Hymenoscyphus fraxineus]|uniref:Uncharacterized protein n=1 Tax=Hymenoscyphus fraxineus TaxID=746836 RepID=A0A9N9KXB6_9HELO|nr:hypothetical protein HYFRA_00004706 [Hymenoscyphus fraxineus]